MKINNYVTILFLFTINICFGQNKIRTAGKYIIGDTIIEVKVYKEDNEIREFKEIKGTWKKKIAIRPSLIQCSILMPAT